MFFSKKVIPIPESTSVRYVEVPRVWKCYWTSIRTDYGCAYGSPCEQAFFSEEDAIAYGKALTDALTLLRVKGHELNIEIEEVV